MSQASEPPAAEVALATGARPPLWYAAAFVLAVVLLVGSVDIPARQTRQISNLRDEITRALAPAQLLVAQLASGVAMESGALQEYALSGDSASLSRYRASARGDDRQLAQLEHLAQEIGGDVKDGVATVRRRIAEWRQRASGPVAPELPRAEFARAIRLRQSSADAILGAIGEVASDLATRSTLLRDRIGGSERFSLLTNAGLVFVSLPLMFAVAALVRREQHLSMSLQRRVEQGVALLNAAEGFASEFTIDAVARHVARSALTVTRASAAFVEQVTRTDDGTPNGVVVKAAVGDGAPPLHMTGPYAGSLAELGASSRESAVVPELADAADASSTRVAGDVTSATLVVPLTDSGGPCAALCILNSSRRRLPSDEVDAARTLGHLASLAYEKVRLLSEARVARVKLERVMASRSRLMRGFSHDVKNPLGAADGYADLLERGIYDLLTQDQRQGVSRIRQAISDALHLIDELHELSRTETGHLALSFRPVALADLVRASGEAYQAAATVRGLSLHVELPVDVPVINTDPARVRQIVGNFLSNAIKYTSSGSIGLRLRHCQRDPNTGDGSWVAVDVSDTGPGISEPNQELLFNEFVRFGGADTRGAGLGLAISQRLARALRGRITVESEAGCGSTFTLWLPIASGEITQ